MSKKIAMIVRAEVATRIVVEVDDDFNPNNIMDFDYEKMIDVAKPQLIRNLDNDCYSVVTDIEEDRDCPYEDNEVYHSIISNL